LSRRLILSGVVAATLVTVSGGSFATGGEDAAKEVEQALHLTPNVDNGRKAFMVCTVCHRPEGWGTDDGMYPQIAGQLPSVTIKQLADIRARNRDNPTMRPFASPQLLGGAQEIADVAAYIAQLPMNPHNSVGPGVDLEYGEQLYKENCVDCHGDRGQGDSKDNIPLIQGQHFQYLMRQFEWIRLGKRRNADPKMVKQIRRFTPRDVSAVMDYVSRLKPPAEKVGEPGWHNPDFPTYARQPFGSTPVPRQPPRHLPPR
jgi:cytochrome c553